MKRLFSILLILILLICPILSANASAAMTQHSDRNLTDILVNLGMFTKSDFSQSNADTIVTRGEAVKLFVKMSGFTARNSFEDSKIHFSDVDGSNVNSTYIYTALSLGFISGEADGAFYPDDPVTTAQIAKIVLSVLGYDKLCQASGGYPVGYLKYASDIRLFSGVNFENDTSVTYKEMEQIIFNALNSEILIQESFGERESYTTYKKRTLLSERFEIYVTEAVITANEYINLYGKTGAAADTIIADDVTYSIQSYKGDIPVGYDCDIYYRESDSQTNELVAIDISKKANSDLVIASEDILEASKTSISYTDDEGNKIKTYVNSNACIIYNGQLASYRSNMFTDADEVKLVDNDNDGSADVVFVNKYTVMLADSFSSLYSTVYDKLSNESYTFEEKGNGYNTVFYYGTEKTDFLEIEKNSVLSVLIPEDVSVKFTYHVYITDTVISGVVQEVYAAEKEVVINDIVYKCSDAVVSSVSPGDKGEFYLDVLGRIAAKDNLGSNSDIKNYAYITGMEKTGFDEVKVRLYTMSGAWLEVYAKNKIKVNSLTVQSDSLFSNELFYKDGNCIRQLVKYKLNAEGDLAEIESAENYTAKRFTPEEEKAINDGVFRLCFESGRSRYVKSGTAQCIDVGSHIDSATVVLFVPNDDANRAEDYYAGNEKNLSHNTYYTNVKVYDCDKMGTASVVVVDSNSGEGKNIMLVTGVSNVLNSEGNETKCVKGLVFGFEVSVNTKTESTIRDGIGDGGDLKSGDVISVGYNSSNEIDVLSRVHDYGDNTFVGVGSNWYNTDMNLYGEVISADTSKIVIDYGTGKGSFMVNNAPIYVYQNNGIRNTAHVGSVNEIQRGDTVYLRIDYMRCTAIVVYKK